MTQYRENVERGEFDPPKSGEELQAMTVEQLKERAADLDLPTSGTKAELIERLQAAR